MATDNLTSTNYPIRNHDDKRSVEQALNAIGLAYDGSVVPGEPMTPLWKDMLSNEDGTYSVCGYTITPATDVSPAMLASEKDNLLISWDSKPTGNLMANRPLAKGELRTLMGAFKEEATETVIGADSPYSDYYDFIFSTDEPFNLPDAPSSDEPSFDR